MKTTSDSGLPQEDTQPVAPTLLELIRTAVRFYDLSAGEGFLISGQPDPADYISEFLNANPDAWDRLDIFVAEAIAAKDARIAELEATIAPFARYAQRELDKRIPRHIQDNPETPVLCSGMEYEDADAVSVSVGDFQRVASEAAGK